jgi:hypothetical protein
MVGDPAVSVYVTWQLPELSVHGDPVKAPVGASDVLNETVPEGLNPDDSVAVQVVVDPAVNWGHDTEITGDALLSVTIVVAGIPALLLLSPE